MISGEFTPLKSLFLSAKNRLQADFQLSVMTTLCACGVFGITPFAIYRFAEGDLLAGFVDLVILISIVAAFVYAWRTGDVLNGGRCLGVIICAGGVAVGSILGINGAFWLFPASLTSYFLCPYRFAATINIVALLILSTIGSAFDITEQMWSFIATSLVVNACAFIFAIRHHAQHEKLQELATHDPLTGAMNRRALSKDLENAVKNARQTGLNYALVMLDLDHFKRINDEYGHHAGDEVLRQCADILRQHIRESDQLFRFGGEEFTLLMTGVSDAGLHAVVDKLRQALQTHLSSPGGPVTASFGVALLKPGEHWEAWLARADNALYMAKEGGRNRVVVEMGAHKNAV